MIYLKRKSPSDPKLVMPIRLPRRSSTLLISGLTNSLVCTAGNGMRHVNQIGAAKIRHHHRREVTGEAKIAAAKDRRRGLARSAQQNQLDVEAVLFINLGLLGNPRNPVAGGERGHAPIDFLERFVLRRAAANELRHRAITQRTRKRGTAVSCMSSSGSMPVACCLMPAYYFCP